MKNLHQIYKNLLEGLEKTYPSDTMVRILKEYLEEEKQSGNISVYQIRKLKDSENEHPRIQVTCVSDFPGMNLELNLKKRFELCGWNIVVKKKDEINGKYVFAYTLEPIFPIDSADVDDFTKNVVERTPDGVFYHVSFSKFANKIERGGLKPKTSGREDFLYNDGRIYLFDEIRSAGLFARLHLSGTHSSHLVKVNQFTIGNTKKVSSFKNPKTGVAVFGVDLGQMLKDGKKIRLYHDSCIGKSGIAYYTRNSIPAKYIKKIGEYPKINLL